MPAAFAIARMVTTSADTRIEVALVEATKPGGLPQLELRLLRRTATGAFESTPAGFRVPLYLAAQIAEAVREVARRGCEHALAEPLPARGIA